LQKLPVTPEQLRGIESENATRLIPRLSA
jgi:hypothetical protein